MIIPKSLLIQGEKIKSFQIFNRTQVTQQCVYDVCLPEGCVVWSGFELKRYSEDNV